MAGISTGWSNPFDRPIVAGVGIQDLRLRCIADGDWTQGAQRIDLVGPLTVRGIKPAHVLHFVDQRLLDERCRIGITDIVRRLELSPIDPKLLDRNICTRHIVAVSERCSGLVEDHRATVVDCFLKGLDIGGDCGLRHARRVGDRQQSLLSIPCWAESTEPSVQGVNRKLWWHNALRVDNLHQGQVVVRD